MTAWEGSDAQYRGEQTKSSEYDRLKAQADKMREDNFRSEAKKRGYLSPEEVAEARDVIGCFHGATTKLQPGQDEREFIQLWIHMDWLYRAHVCLHPDQLPELESLRAKVNADPIFAAIADASDSEGAQFQRDAKARGYVPASQFAEAINAIRAVIPDFRSREWRDDYAKREAPEDPEVLALCKKHGFGAVMGSASRQWYRLDPCGAFVVNFAAGMERIMGDKLRKAVGQEDGV